MISGLAYNVSAGVLWEATNSYSDTIYELNPDDCTVLSTLAHPTPGYNGGGLEVDQALYQSQRIDPYAYRFEAIPNGMYQVELKFAELSYVGFGRRITDVLIEDTKVLSEHDIRYDEGLLFADDHTFFVEVTDSRLDIRFEKIDGSEPPVINAIRVTHRPDR
jgi:hypothetical protein